METNKPMTLQEAKNHIAKDYGYDNWWSIDFTRFDQEIARDKVAELYCQSQTASLQSELEALKVEHESVLRSSFVINEDLKSELDKVKAEVEVRREAIQRMMEISSQKDERIERQQEQLRENLRVIKEQKSELEALRKENEELSKLSSKNPSSQHNQINLDEIETLRKENLLKQMSIDDQHRSLEAKNKRLTELEGQLKEKNEVIRKAHQWFKKPDNTPASMMIELAKSLESSPEQAEQTLYTQPDSDTMVQPAPEALQQEELASEMFAMLYDAYERGKGSIEDVLQKFTITRK